MNKNISITSKLDQRLKRVADRTGRKQGAIIVRGIEIAVEILEKEKGFMATGKFNPAVEAEKKIKFQGEV